MIDSFNCDLCDSSLTSKSRKKHLKSKQHKYVTSHIVYRYFIINPELHQIRNIFKECILEHEKKFEFYLVICKLKLHFSDDIVLVIMDKYMWLPHGVVIQFNKFILSKINAIERDRYAFSHVSEATFSFVSSLDKITYEHYLTIPKPMIEWGFNILLSRKPELGRLFENSSHPLFIKYKVDNNDDDDGEK